MSRLRPYAWEILAASLMLVIWFLPWRFQTNDDVIMMWLVSGAYTGQPESYAVFIHPALSGIISRLYQLNSEIPWYGLLCYASIALAGWVSLRVVEKMSYSRQRVVFWKLFLLALIIHFCFFPQFTLIAGFLTVSGLLFGSRMMNSSQFDRILAVLALVLGLLWRKEAALLIFLGWFWYRIMFRPEGKRMLYGFYICWVLGLLLAVGTQRMYERRYVEADFLEFNRIRAKVIDHPMLVGEYFAHRIPVNSDWYFFSRWMFEELPIGMTALEEKKEQLDKLLFNWEELPASLFRLIKVQLTELFKSALILILLIHFMLTVGSVPRKWLFLAGWLFFFICFNYFNLLLGRVTLLFFLVLLFPILLNAEEKSSPKFFRGFSVLLALFLVVHLFNFLREAKGRTILNEEFEELLSSKPSSNLVFLEGFFEYNFKETYSIDHPVPVIAYGWVSRSPFQQKAYLFRGQKDQKSLTEFSLIAVKMPEPLAFPNYMERISPGFELVGQKELPNLIRLDYQKISR